MKLRSFGGILLILVVILANLALDVEASRGLWVVRYNLVSPEEIDQIIGAATSGGITDIYAQVCGRGEAYYQSRLLPPAPGIQEGFDPLSYLLKRAHQRGIQVHAWVNAYTAASWSRVPDSDKHVLNQHPDWVLADSSGRSVLTYEGSNPDLPAIFLDPGIFEVRQFVSQVIAEIVDNYQIDGVHLDYIRYPGVEYGYSEASLRAFKAAYGWQPLEDGMQAPLEWDNWRRAQVTATVESVQQVIKTKSPKVQLSAAVQYDPALARKKYLQDWPDWLDKGLVDYVVPMVYFEDYSQFARALENIKHWVGTEKIYPGIGAYMIADDPAALRSQMQLVTDLGFDKLVFFEYRTMAENAVFSQLQKGLP